jgi:branched-chain amino acid transport system ATP-binding protein
MTECLAYEAVSAGYGATVVLERVGLSVQAGEIIAVLGRNGVGKTTLLATAMGHTTLHAGAVKFQGHAIQRLRPYQRARLGMGYVPQEREIFPSLSVIENLSVARRPGAWTQERVFELFPQLHARRTNMGNQLSGGEQQMLAVARALVGNPSLLLLDEPLEGLAPVIVDTLMGAFNKLRAADGLTIVLVEQHARLALEFAARAAILDRGQVVYDGPSRALLDDPEKLSELIAVSG